MQTSAADPHSGHLGRALQKYTHILQAQVINSLAYPGELIGRSLIIIPFMWIFTQLWQVTFAAAGTDVINGLTVRDTLWYLMLAETIELSRPRLSLMIAETVKDGSIAYVLTRPLNYLLYQFSMAMGETIFRWLVNLVLGGVVIWLLIGPPPHLAGILFALPTILGAWILNFYISVLIGLAAFITEDVSAFNWIYQKFAFILGGLLIPLDFYPPWLQAIARALPFSALMYGPARLFVSPSLPALASTLGMQIAWIVVIGACAALAYRRGIAYLTVNGG